MLLKKSEEPGRGSNPLAVSLQKGRCYMKKHNGGVAARVKHTRKFTGRRVNKGERRKSKLALKGA